MNFLRWASEICCEHRRNPKHGKHQRMWAKYLRKEISECCFFLVNDNRSEFPFASLTIPRLYVRPECVSAPWRHRVNIKSVHKRDVLVK